MRPAPGHQPRSTGSRQAPLHALLRGNRLMQHRHMLRCLAFLLSLAVAVPVGAREIWLRHWIEVQSPDFVLVSDLSRSTTVKLARDLEDFRVVVSLLLHEQPAVSRIPTIVYIVPESFKIFGTRFTLRASRVIASNDRSKFQLRHQYARLRLRPDGRVKLPRWYEEGMAQMFRDMSIRSDSFGYWEPTSYSPHPYGDILDSGSWPESEYWARLEFTAQSWSLVNYLIARFGATETSAHSRTTSTTPNSLWRARVRSRSRPRCRQRWSKRTVISRAATRSIGTTRRHSP
jgi:hypothetical protein